MRYSIILIIVFFVNTLLSQSYDNRRKQIDNIVYLTDIGFVTNIIIERSDSKLALLTNYDFATIIGKRFNFDKSIGDSLRGYLLGGYNESSLWYSEISRYIVSDSLYKKISVLSPCAVYSLYYSEKGFPKDKKYSDSEIRSAVAYLIKNDIKVVPDFFSFYSIDVSPCRKKNIIKNRKRSK